LKTYLLTVRAIQEVEEKAVPEKEAAVEVEEAAEEVEVEEVEEVMETPHLRPHLQPYRV